MKIFNRLLRISLPVLLLVSFVIPFMPVDTVQAEGENWLTGWDYRKQQIADGSTDGVQTDYPMPLWVYKDYPPITEHAVKQPMTQGGTSTSYEYNGVVYVAWHGDDLDPYIDAYNITSKTWHGAVKVGTNPLSGDSHGAPNIIVDNSGYIHVFYGSHNTALKYAKSTNPEDISSWSAQSDIGSSTTYPQSCKDDSGVLYLLLREADGTGSKSEYIRTSADNFSSSTLIIGVEDSVNDWLYCRNNTFDSTNDRIHLTWVHRDKSPGDVMENVYHAYYDVTDSHLYAMDGTDLGTSISYAESESDCKIVSETTFGVLGSTTAKLDSSNYPYVMYIKNTAGDPAQYHISWNGSSWGSENLVVSNSTAFTHFVTASDDIDAYVTINGDLRKYSWNGSSWSLDSTVIDSVSIHAGDGLARVCEVNGYSSGIKVLCGGLDADDYDNADIGMWGIDGNDKIVAGKGYAGCEGNCLDTFADIRFTESDGDTTITPWHDDGEYSSGVRTKFWIPPASVAANTTTNVYMYYGNAVANMSSNGSACFTQFEDFEAFSDGEAIDSGSGLLTWTISAGDADGSADYAHGGTKSMKLDDQGSPQASVYFSQADSESIAIRYRLYRVTANTEFALLHGDGTGKTNVNHSGLDPDFNSLAYKDDVGQQDTGWDSTPGNWYLYEISGFDWTNHTYDIYAAGSCRVDDADMITNSNQNGLVNFIGGDQGVGNDCYVDNIIVRKWTADEPEFVGSGTQETESGVSSPTVTSISSASVEETTANLTGNITATGGENPDTRGFQWGTSTGVYSTNQTESGNYSTGTYWLTVTSLPPGDEVYWRATANNSGGYGYGSEMYLETKPNDPSSLTSPSQTDTSIYLTWSKGTGAENTTVRYQTGSYPATYNDGSSAYNGNGTTVNVTGLSASTTYFFRAWSISTDNTTIYSDGYSQVTQATSAPGATPPTVTTSNATDLDCSSVTGNGNITSIGSANVTYRGFQYGIGSFTDNVSESGNYGTGVFDISITGLADNTTYQYRSFAQNDAGISYGSSVNFTTTASSNPTFTTVAASSITDTTARLNGTISGLDCDQADDTFWEWGLSTGNYTANYTDTTNRSNGAVFYALSSLTANTTYYFRGAARLNGGAWQYGGELNFTTDNETVTSSSDFLGLESFLSITPVIIISVLIALGIFIIFIGFKSREPGIGLQSKNMVIMSIGVVIIMVTCACINIIVSVISDIMDAI